VTPVLRARGIDAHHGALQALTGIDLDVAAGETLAVIGANGAGKTTLLRALCGLVAVSPGARVELDGTPLDGLSTHRRARAGLTMVPEGRRLFPSLTVEENLLVGAPDRVARRVGLRRVHGLFPALHALRHRPAGTLSGGEQQSVAIGRGVMADPRVLLLDEVSLGLAPARVAQLHAALATLAEQGTALLVVEQDVGAALRAADRVVCLRAGRTVLTGPAHALTAAAVTSAYFGTETP
jgi:branched-chain amino acid transport system ATP-binding protein